jgi:hypothetical protein
MNVQPLAAFLVLAYPAIAQVEHGSVGIVHLSKDEISVAADSRTIRKGRNGNPDIESNAMCKVAAFGNDLVFVSTGTARFLEMPGVPGWDNVEEARSAYRNVVSRYSTLKGHVEEVGSAWATDIATRFSQLGSLYPEQFQAAITNQGDLTVAFFGGEDAMGIFMLFGVQILPGRTNAFNLFPAAIPTSNRVTCPDNSFCAIGRSDIMIEFAAARTQRARREKARWKPAKPYAKGTIEYTMFRTMRMVELTVEYQGAGVKDVGGPIDGVQLFRHNGIVQKHWYARKPNCQED